MVGEFERQIGVLFDQQNADAFLLFDALDDLENVLDHAWGQTKGWLVEDQEAGLHHQGPRDRQHLLLAAGQRAPLLPAALGEDREIAVHALDVGRRLAQPRIAAESEIFLDGQPDEGAAPFRHVRHPEAGNVLGGAPLQPLAGEDDLAFHPHHAADGTQRRGLAGAVGAEEHGHAAFLDRKVDPVHDLRLAVKGLQSV